jgi:hypothetical protein
MKTAGGPGVFRNFFGRTRRRGVVAKLKEGRIPVANGRKPQKQGFFLATDPKH